MLTDGRRTEGKLKDVFCDSWLLATMVARSDGIYVPAFFDKVTVEFLPAVIFVFSGFRSALIISRPANLSLIILHHNISFEKNTTLLIPS